MAVPIFTLDAATKQLIQDGFDTMIEELGRPCKLILDGVRQPCPNCTFDAASGRSSGIYNGTGAVHFLRPPCPVCQGSGYDPASSDIEEVRTFSLKRNLKPWAVFPREAVQSFTRPVTLARIKGFVTDLPVVLQAKYIILDHENALYTTERYRKISEPGPTGQLISGRYFICYLQREEA